jgi:hypothetical protein
MRRADRVQQVAEDDGGLPDLSLGGGAVAEDEAVQGHGSGVIAGQRADGDALLSRGVGGLAGTQARRCLEHYVAGGHTESEIMPLADTVAVQDVLGEIAGQLGMRVIEGPAELP